MQAGRSGSWHWTNQTTGRESGSIGYSVRPGCVTLNYSIDDQPRTQTISVNETACNFGGTRQWFICPIRFERVAVLYLRAGRFACRHCQRLAYASQSNDAIGRTWRRQHKIERKLGENWQRPKGMHQTTYDRLLSTIGDCEEKRDAALSRFLAGMMDRHPSLRSDPMLRGMF